MICIRSEAIKLEMYQPHKKMSKRKEQKKKVVVTTNTQKKKTVKTQSNSPKAKAKSSRATSAAAVRSQAEFTFNSENYKWMGIGVALIVLGMVLMGGGSMPSPDVWDENIIYGFRRTVLAPIVILAGLGLQVFAIFKKS